MANETPTGIPPIPPRYEGLDDAETFGRLRSIPGRIEPTAAAFFAEWIAGLPAVLQAVSGDKQTGTIGTVLAASLVVKVIDGGGNPSANVPVEFQVRELDARIDGRIAITALTGLDGRATVNRWRLGQSVGTQHVDVAVGSARATFTAEATDSGYSTPTLRPQSPPKSSGSKTS
jgi:hypothetical protein